MPKLKRAELNAACEDFSNVIGSSSMGTVYKGTLSSGVEIAVTSLIVASANNWPKNMESQFRKKASMKLVSSKRSVLRSMLLNFVVHFFGISD